MNDNLKYLLTKTKKGVHACWTFLKNDPSGKKIALDWMAKRGEKFIKEASRETAEHWVKNGS